MNMHKKERQTLLVWLSYNSTFESIGVMFHSEAMSQIKEFMMATNEEMFFKKGFMFECTSFNVLKETRDHFSEKHDDSLWAKNWSSYLPLEFGGW